MPARSRKRGRRRTPRSLLAVLCLASVTAITLDHGGEESPLDPVRGVVSDVVGPGEKAAAVVARPLAEVPGFFTTNTSLRSRIERLEAENAALRGQVATTSEVRQRAAQLDGLLAGSKRAGVAVVAARVIGIGPAQSFSSTVTIDAGRSAGVRPDMTVMNHSGLVGRVISAGRTSATVLLIVDTESVVGARLGSSAEVGFLRGRGDLDGTGRLDLDLVDSSETPAEDDVVTTWGSPGKAPYVPGIPIGSVEAVFSSPREMSKHAVVEPFVDFSSLDLVGVVVEAGTTGDRTVIDAGDLPGSQEEER